MRKVFKPLQRSNQLMSKTAEKIILELELYCKKYDIPLGNIIEVISDLKVIPMIRGKAFEFTAANKLKALLSASIDNSAT